ncbi:MAG: hypothetical protein H8E98_04920 [Bacteroidetes bacterium]|nr:hypothetical protein [Bacteroidota bacterium]
MKTAPWIIIVILLVLLFLQRECASTHICPVHPEVTCDTIHDTISYPVTVYIPKITCIDTGTTKWLYYPVDTAQILTEYFAKHYYQDTLVNDTNALIVVKDTITQNKIMYRNPVITIFPHFIKQTTYIVQPQPLVRKVFLGIGIGRSINQFALSPSLMYISKKDNAYSLSYDVLNKDIYLTMFWKLKIY